jgi:hypothetical protein
VNASEGEAPVRRSIRELAEAAVDPAARLKGVAP